MSHKSFKDQLGRMVDVPFPPQRIVSLVPSQTELLHDLGVADHVAGITKFCIHPHAWTRTVEKVGGSKTFHIDRIQALQPDLIIANKEENGEALIRQLMDEFPVWVSNVITVDDALAMIHTVGEMVGSAQHNAMIAEISTRLSQAPPGPPRRAAYLIWNEPVMVAGGGTFINSMLKVAGFENVYSEEERYPATTQEDLAQKQPDVVLLSSEPFPFSEKHIATYQQACPGARILCVDATYFSWYGSRMLGAMGYFRGL